MVTAADPIEFSPEDQFTSAAANARRDEMKRLLEQGVDVNCRSSGLGETALHCAAQMGSVRTVSFLLDHGADIDALDGLNLTPLAVACLKGKKMGSAVAILLLEKGANACYVRESDGMTAYKFALWGGCTDEVLDALLRAGATLPDSTFRRFRFTQE